MGHTAAADARRINSTFANTICRTHKSIQAQTANGVCTYQMHIYVENDENGEQTNENKIKREAEQKKKKCAHTNEKKRGDCVSG